MSFTATLCQFFFRTGNVHNKSKPYTSARGQKQERERVLCTRELASKNLLRFVLEFAGNYLGENAHRAREELQHGGSST